MNIKDVRKMNQLFIEVYPYIAKEIMDEFGRGEGTILEIGPFSPGVSLELARRFPKFKFIVGDDDSEVVEYLSGTVRSAKLQNRFTVRVLSKHQLPFVDGQFDLIIFRGGLFFWENTEKILQEIYRVLKPEGMAAVGGGFGKKAPKDLVAKIRDEVREINRRLGKRNLTKEEIVGIIHRAKVNATMVEHKHGVWIFMKKPEA